MKTAAAAGQLLRWAFLARKRSISPLSSSLRPPSEDIATKQRCTSKYANSPLLPSPIILDPSPQLAVHVLSLRSLLWVTHSLCGLILKPYPRTHCAQSECLCLPPSPCDPHSFATDVDASWPAVTHFPHVRPSVPGSVIAAGVPSANYERN